LKYHTEPPAAAGRRFGILDRIPELNTKLFRQADCQCWIGKDRPVKTSVREEKDDRDMNSKHINRNPWILFLYCIKTRDLEKTLEYEI